MAIPVNYTDTTQTWTTDEHKNRTVIMYDGYYKYRASFITGNSSNQLFLSNGMGITLGVGNYAIIPTYVLSPNDIGNTINISASNDYAIALPPITSGSSESTMTRIRIVGQSNSDSGYKIYLISQSKDFVISNVELPSYNTILYPGIVVVGTYDTCELTITSYYLTGTSSIYKTNMSREYYRYYDANLTDFGGSVLIINCPISKNYTKVFNNGDLISNTFNLLISELGDGMYGNVILNNASTSIITFSDSNISFPSNYETINKYYTNVAATDIAAGSIVSMDWKYTYGIFTYSWNVLQ